jgi:hypothetical protein|tara:strand:- start:36 stop:299 length:264 start_codon:yes stop_codon:yes gene_type:complete
MRITKRQLRRIIREEAEQDSPIDAESPYDIETRKDAWAGGDNLENPVDHPHVVGAEKTTTAPETASITERKRRLRRIISKVLSESRR